MRSFRKFDFQNPDPHPNTNLGTTEQAEADGKMTKQTLQVWILKPIVLIHADSVFGNIRKVG